MPRYSPHAAKAGKHTAQDGSILTMAAIVLSTAVILLASIDIGFLFYQKRELQKIADMAAIAGAQQLAKDCQFAANVAVSNAQIAHDFPLTPIATIGRWSPSISNALHFEETGCESSANAVRVEATRSFGRFFGTWASQSIRASAIATSGESFAVFSVGSRLLSIKENGTVPLLLKAVGADISGTDVLSYQGLADVSLDTTSILRQLGFEIPLQADIGTVKHILQTSSPSSCDQGSCSLGAVLGAISTVGGQHEIATLLRLPDDVLNHRLHLLSTDTARGILTITDAANGQVALLTKLSALDLANTALLIANGERFKNLDLNAALPNLASVTSKVGIVETPSIAVGGVGATAYTAQVRTYLHAKTGINSLVGIDLPVVLDLANGKGTIKSLCETPDAQGNHTVDIEVETPLLHACIGAVNENTIFSRTNTTVCETGLQTPSDPLISLLGLQLRTHLEVKPPLRKETVTLSMANPTKTVPENRANNPLKETLDALIFGSLGKLLAGGQGSVTNNSLANALLNNRTLSQAGNMLDSALTSLSNFLSNVSDASKSALDTSLASNILGLLNNLGGLVNGLLSSIGNLLSNLLNSLTCLISPNQCLANELSGNQGSGANSISKVMLSILGLVQSVLTPIMDALTSPLQNLLGTNIGEVDVKLIDLQCGGGSNVRLVH